MIELKDIFTLALRPALLPVEEFFDGRVTYDGHALSRSRNHCITSAKLAVFILSGASSLIEGGPCGASSSVCMFDY
jgi:hypothetical protein